MAIGDIWKGTVLYQVSEEVLSFSLHWLETDTALPVGGAIDLAQNIETWVNDELEGIAWGDKTQLLCIEIHKINSSDYYPFKLPSRITGTAGNGVLPDNCTVVVSLLTASGNPRNQTKLQLSGAPLDSSVLSVLTQVYRDGVNGSFAWLRDNPFNLFTGGTLELCVPTVVPGSDPPVYTPNLVTGVSTSPVHGSRFDRKANTPNTGRKPVVVP